jgi:phosphatidylserine/phosphatidylglycerophosphate/cardiolipin synthase-like enzyme
MKIEALAEALGRPTLPAFRRLMARIWLAADDAGIIARPELGRVLGSYNRIQPNELLALLLGTGIVVERSARDAYLVAGERANMFEAAIAVEASNPEVDSNDTWFPVATIPDRDAGVPRRVKQTASVVFSLIDEAQRELWLVTPFLDPPSVAFFRGPISTAASRGVLVKILTAGQNEKFVEALMDSLNSQRDSVSVWFANDDISSLGTHAKAVVADLAHAYLGSANLTSWGMQKHFEIGALLEGPSVAVMVSLFERLAATGRRYVYDEDDLRA